MGMFVLALVTNTAVVMATKIVGRTHMHMNSA